MSLEGKTGNHPLVSSVEFPTVAGTFWLLHLLKDAILQCSVHLPSESVTTALQILFSAIQTDQSHYQPSIVYPQSHILDFGTCVDYLSC